MKMIKVLVALAMTVSCETGFLVEREAPAHYTTEQGDQLMRLLIEKGFAKEKEDSIDRHCGCDCTCC